ncbi:MAG: class I SAM-dependent methyltransferase [Candidatus Hydrogenedentes bacterium]|nr:class I SAM-dependent methyltransferase [Candidatus Hydrogenedentota bacterium]
MNVTSFQDAFNEKFRGRLLNLPTYEYWDPIVSHKLDLCPDVDGKLSLKKQQLLNLAFGFLDAGEAYFEVGTYQGKSLISAMIENAPRPVFACDNFSQFDDNTLETLQKNLSKYGLSDRVTFFNCDFLEAYTASKLTLPIGLYFYDGAHDYTSQYEAIKRVEPFLSDEALVLVDDWRHDFDSDSLAKDATLQAAAESTGNWTLLYELPARFNGDRAMWWNGVGVLSFRRAV